MQGQRMRFSSVGSVAATMTAQPSIPMGATSSEHRPYRIRGLTDMPQTPDNVNSYWGGRSRAGSLMTDPFLMPTSMPGMTMPGMALPSAPAPAARTLLHQPAVLAPAAAATAYTVAAPAPVAQGLPQPIGAPTTSMPLDGQFFNPFNNPAYMQYMQAQVPYPNFHMGAPMPGMPLPMPTSGGLPHYLHAGPLHGAAPAGASGMHHQAPMMMMQLGAPSMGGYATMIGAPSPCGSCGGMPVEAQDGLTTFMLRNIPVKYNRDTMLGDMDQRGFRGAYDFFYLPIDFQTGNTVGYAFVNFATAYEAARFRSTYNGLQLSQDSTKICEVSVAKAQGKAKNVEQYRNSSVMAMEERFKPLVFENGVRVPFPLPTRSLKPVKPRAK